MFCCTNKRLLIPIVIGFLAVLGLAYVFHWQVILTYAPFLLILMCPLMHLFMGGHGSHDAQQHATKNDKDKPSCH